MRWKPFSRLKNLKNPTWATVTTPDELIAARIIDSFAREFDRWRLFGTFEADERHTKAMVATEDVVLTNQSKKLELRWKRTEPRLVYKDYLYLYDNHVNVYSCTINGVAMASDVSRRIIASYTRLREQKAEAERVAAEALAKMELEQKKWDLAEKCFGILRDGFGRIQLPQYED